VSDVAQFGKIYWLAVDDPRHTSVLGYRASTKQGAYLWGELDWSEWWIDGVECNYLHVACRKDCDNDGCVYRVRCFYAGGKYRGREVQSVSIGTRGGKLHWIVRCKANAT
jgi:hypothetical protein